MNKKKYFIVYLVFIGLIFLSFNFNIKPVKALDTGAVDFDGYDVVYSDWNNPSNALTQDDSYADGVNNEYQDWYITEVEFPQNLNNILGIVVYADIWGDASYVDVELSWNGGSSWTSTSQQFTGYGTSDTDTYKTVGGSSYLWGRTWARSEFEESNFVCYVHISNEARKYAKIDHIYVKIYYDLYASPEGSGLGSSGNNTQYGNCTCLNLTMVSGYANTMYNIGYPCCTPINASVIWNMFNDTDNINALWIFIPKDQDFWLYIPQYPAFDFTVYPNQAIWVDITGNVSICWDCHNDSEPTLIENIVNATGTHVKKWDSVNEVWKVWANYTGNTTTCNSTNLSVIQNLTHVTGGYETDYNNNTGWKVWFNATSNINLIENIVNATGTHEYIDTYLVNMLGDGNYSVWANYTGNTSGSCGTVYFSFSDENISISGYVNCTSGTNNTNYTINETNWFNLLGTLTIDEGQFGIFITLTLFFLFFNIGYMSPKRSGGLFMIFSGFIFFAFEYVASTYLHSIILALLGVFGIFIIILGIRKWLYPFEKENVKSEGQ